MIERMTSAPDDLASAVAESDAAWQRFWAAVERAPRERTDEPGVCGAWSLKILVGHIAFWDQFEATYFELGDRPTVHNWQTLNDANVEATAPRPYDDVRNDMVINHERLDWVLRSQTNLDAGEVRRLIRDHYLEHAEQIEAWLAASAMREA